MKIVIIVLLSGLASAVCDVSCATCADATTSGCLTCSGSGGSFRELYGTSCLCLIGYYHVAGNAVCSLCSYKCLACSAAGNFCTLCDATKKRNNGNICPCTFGFFDDGSSSMCATCSPLCYACSALNTCTSCDGTYLRVIATGNVCNCILNYYSSGLIPMCQPCDRTCFSCSGGLPSNCLSCNNSAYRTFSAGTTSCPCDTYYWDDGVSKPCLACSYTCGSCVTGSAPTQCATCDSFTNRWMNAGACSPNTGFYDAGMPVCEPCHYSCLNCTAFGAAACSACNSADLRTISGTLCPCNIGFFENNTKLCAACDYSCLTCSGPTSSNCLTCLASRFISSNTCQCNAGTYDNRALTTCSVCINNCATCLSSTYCLSCNAAANFFLNTIYCDCNPTFFVSGTSCLTCATTCATCSSAASTCLSCYSAAQFRYLSGNTCICNIGNFDAAVDICSTCSTSCLTCSGAAGTCLTCDLSMLRVFSAGTCPCDNKYFDSGAAACSPCFADCLTCSGSLSTNCVLCPPDKYFSGGSCLCNPGTYWATGNVCLSCHPTCLSCNSASISDCTSCYTNSTLTTIGLLKYCYCNFGYYMDANNFCRPCDVNCAGCSFTPTNCSSCNGAALLTLVGTVCICPNPYYYNAGSCILCDPSCMTCSGTSTQCLSCLVSQFRYLVAQACICYTGYYDPPALVCLLCGPTCLTCSTFTNCLSCSWLVHRVLNVNICECLPGYYDVGTCLACDPSCLTCSSATFCLSCDLSIRTMSASNTCDCRTGSYTSGTSCISCHPNCLACFGNSFNQCTACSPAAQAIGTSCLIIVHCGLMVLHLGVCKSACPPSYFNSSGYCASCPETCFSCLSYVQCLSCLNSLYIQAATCVPYCTPTFYYVSPNYCKSCPTNCFTCSGITGKVICSSCLSGFSYYLYDCVSPCPSQYYPALSICQNCQLSCLSCLGPLPTHCLSCRPAYIVSPLGTCVHCMSQQFSASGFCLPCALPCRECLGNLCTSCYSTHYFADPLCVPFGQYSTPTTLAPCPSFCYHCTSPTNCLICAAHRGDFRNAPVKGQCHCFPPYYQNYQGVCVQQPLLGTLNRLVLGLGTAMLIVCALTSLISKSPFPSLRLVDGLQLAAIFGTYSERLRLGVGQSLSLIENLFQARILLSSDSGSRLLGWFIGLTVCMWLIGGVAYFIRWGSLIRGSRLNTKNIFYTSSKIYIAMVCRLPFYLLYLMVPLLALSFELRGVNLVLTGLVLAYLLLLLLWLTFKLFKQRKTPKKLDPRLFFLIVHLQPSKMSELAIFYLPALLLAKLAVSLFLTLMPRLLSMDIAVFSAAGFTALTLVFQLLAAPIARAQKRSILASDSFLILFCGAVLLLEKVDNQNKLLVLYGIDGLVLLYCLLVVLLQSCSSAAESCKEGCEEWTARLWEYLGLSDGRYLFQREREAYQDDSPDQEALEVHWRQVTK